MSNISALRKNNALDKLLAQVAKEEAPAEKTSYVDDRLWRPNVDKSGNGYAVIRFLPANEGQLPWVRVWNHAFQGPTGMWYIENSLTTLNQKDPVSEHNSQLWNSGIESDKEIARKQKRKLQYYSNILVVSDSSNPENEGKVMLYKYGKKIFDKVMEAMQPQFEDEEPINPFDPWEGANFKLKIRKVDGYWNYDKSEFDKSTKIGNDEKIESVISKLYALSEFLSDSNFKSYEELKKRLDTVLTGTQTASKPIAEVLDDEEEYKPSFSSSPSKMENVPFSQEDDEENAMSYFQKLANE
tara:strand:+ start:1279 stop:2172 length:894 start_codon:yes stop_codon:yes gene_type:complete